MKDLPKLGGLLNTCVAATTAKEGLDFLETALAHELEREQRKVRELGLALDAVHAELKLKS
jgi:hypothetical protein